MNEKAFAKYQYSYMVNDKDMIVIRVETSQELENAVNKIKELFPKEVKLPATTPSIQQGANSKDKFCDIHNTPLEWGKGKNPPHKPYLFHKTEDGKFCFGK